tara:strand:+ start:4512 stop:5426 length:915 start_codon:yes stop_codon:yes gene_type:complete
MAGGTGQQQSLITAVPQALGASAMGTAAGLGYQPQQINAATAGQLSPIQAQQINAGQLAGANLQAYQNPYEQQVVNQSLSDIERQRQMQQNMMGAQAQSANAFGGSRFGIAEAETNRAFADQAARTASGLRLGGYQNAQQMAQQDLASQMQAQTANQQAALSAGTTSAQMQQQTNLANQQANMQSQMANQQAGLGGAQFRLGAANQLGDLSNLGFGMGRQVNQDLAVQGAMQQALQQQLIDASRAQYQDYTQAPIQALQTQLGAYGGSQTGEQTQTTTKKPGLFDYLSLGAGVAGSYLGRPQIT